MSKGVCYSGTFQDHTGYGEANRQDIAALYISGIDLTTELVVQVSERSDLAWQSSLAHELKGRKNDYKVKIIHLTPDLYENYKEPGTYHIGRLMWETDRLPLEWVPYCNKMDEIWATSSHMADLFKRSGVKVPIYSFPQPIDISLSGRQYERFYIPQHQGFLFYSIFQWIERKNPRALIKAYLEEFSGESDVSLLLKCFRLSYDDKEVEKIRDDIRNIKIESGVRYPPRIFLAPNLLTHNEIMKLHNTGDCFVLPHRGEGWSRPIQEALLVGKIVIATARGGIHEYLRNEHYFGIDSEYVGVTTVPWIKFYTEDQKWAEVDHAHLRKLMRFVFDHRDEAQAKGMVAQEFIKENFSYQKIGQKMAERINNIYKSL